VDTLRQRQSHVGGVCHTWSVSDADRGKLEVKDADDHPKVAT
jgi:hypothetical protein